MVGPVVDRVVEDRADQRVGADGGIEAIHQPGQAVLVDTFGLTKRQAVHRPAPIEYLRYMYGGELNM